MPEAPTGWRRLFVVNEVSGSHRIAARAAISVLVPLLVVYAADQPRWSLYATFGAFTALYGRERVDLPRVRLQVVAGCSLVLAVTLGAVVAVSAERAWLAVPIAAVLAAVVTWVSGTQGWHPPGSLFCLFGFAAVASVPGTWEQVGEAAAVAASAAAFAVVVGNVGAVVRRVRRTAAITPAGPAIGGARGRWVRQAWMSGLGVAIAGSIATGAGIGRPYWAMVSAVVPLVAPDFGTQVVRGTHRVMGTAGGLVVAWALLELHLPVLTTILLVGLLQALTELVVGRHYAAALLFITPLALLMVHLAAPIPVRELLTDRGLETLIGVAVGLAIGWAGRIRRTRPLASPA
ncbi:MAG TPA: FUSC family protein [Nocardioides sp.]|nr:FUSC family protein [Nocardioides sp.]